MLREEKNYEVCDRQVKNILDQNDIQDLFNIVFHEIRNADKKIKKHSQIISNYLTNIDYKNDDCTLEQAENAIMLWGEKFRKYQILLSKLHQLGAE
jgi:F0F1-type ATP synthase, beta subunit